jgi:hypothetical protein
MLPVPLLGAEGWGLAASRTRLPADSDFPHSCRHGQGPHDLCKKDNDPAVYAQCAAAAGSPHGGA